MMANIKNNAGFTLLELMLVVIIISIGASVTIFSIRGSMPDTRLSAAARDLKSDLSLARLRAIKDHRNVQIQFNDAAGTYTIFVDANRDSIFDAGEAVQTVTMPDGINITADTISTVTFNTRGLPGSNGFIDLQNSNNKYRRVAMTLTGKSTILASNDGSSSFVELH